MTVLLADIQVRGLLDQAMVVVRMPRLNDNDGRDHDNGFRTGPVDNVLLADLQAKGLLDQTLVVLGTEFGRTRVNDNDRRDPGRPPSRGAAGPDAGGSGHRVRPNAADQRQRRAELSRGSGCVAAVRAVIKSGHAQGLHPPRQLRGDPGGGDGPGPGDARPARRPPGQGTAGPNAGGPGHRVRSHAEHHDNDGRDHHEMFTCLLAVAREWTCASGDTQSDDFEGTRG